MIKVRQIHDSVKRIESLPEHILILLQRYIFSQRSLEGCYNTGARLIFSESIHAFNFLQQKQLGLIFYISLHNGHCKLKIGVAGIPFFPSYWSIEMQPKFIALYGSVFRNSVFSLLLIFLSFSQKKSVGNKALQNFLSTKEGELLTILELRGLTQDLFLSYGTMFSNSIC